MTTNDPYVFLKPRGRARRVSFGSDVYRYGGYEITVAPGGTALLLAVTQAQWKEAVEQYAGRITIMLPPYEEPPRAKSKKKTTATAE
jgi:hypothetical protein